MIEVLYSDWPALICMDVRGGSCVLIRAGHGWGGDWLLLSLIIISSIHPINPSKGRPFHVWKKSHNSWNTVHCVISRAGCPFAVHIAAICESLPASYCINRFLDYLSMCFHHNSMLRNVEWYGYYSRYPEFGEERTET
jgi:hypothetical protein